MQSTEPLDPNRLQDCIALLLATDTPELARKDILDIAPQEGGLFNFLLRTETTQGTFFFKQYLDGVKNDIYDLPEIPASRRSLLAYKVQRLAAESVQPLGAEVVPEILHFDSERNAFLMARAAGDTPFIESLRVGEIPKVTITDLPKVLACLHQATYGRFSHESLYGNCQFRDFKLKIQYDDIASRLQKHEADVVLECKSVYQSRAMCVTHGDINSRNILVGDNQIGVIDFEQSHLGTPAYDLAYILSEIFISLECYHNGSQKYDVIHEFLENYFSLFRADTRAAVESEITTHLAIQVLYRFWGPSRAAWTFYVDETMAEAIIQRARSLLMQTGPISECLAP